MYELVKDKKKTVYLAILIGILVTTYLSVNIIVTKFHNEVFEVGNYKLIYAITFIVIILLNIFNFIYIKIFLTIFHINKSNLIIMFYSVILMCLMILIYPININIITKLIIKVIIFNLIFQEKKIESDIFILSLIIGIVDLLMTLLLQWR